MSRYSAAGGSTLLELPVALPGLVIDDPQLPLRSGKTNDEVGARLARRTRADPKKRQFRADDAGGAKLPVQRGGADGDDDRVPPTLLFPVPYHRQGRPRRRPRVGHRRVRLEDAVDFLPEPLSAHRS